MSRESKLVKNTFILSIGTFLPKLASTITLPILTGCLTKEEFGTYDLISVLVSLLLPAATLQIQAAAFRFLIDVRTDLDSIKSLITNIVLFILPTSLFALIILYLALFDVSADIRIWICLYFFADIIVNAARQICRGLNYNLEYSISAIISAIGKMVFAILFVNVFPLGLLGAVISLCMASTFSFLYLLLKVRLWEYVSISRFDKSLLKEMLAYSWPMVPNSMSAWVMRVSDRLVVTFFLGVATNAVYSVANKIPSLLNLAQNTFTLAWQENASVVSKDDDASTYYSSMFEMMYNLMSGFFGLLIAATPILFALLIRGDYEEAYKQMPILFLGMFFFGMSTFLGGIYVAYKESKSVGITTTLAAAANLVINLSLIRMIGLYAASISTFLSYLLLFIFRLIDVQRIVEVKYSLRHMLMLFVVMLLESSMCYVRVVILDCLNCILGLIVFIILNRPVLASAYSYALQVVTNRGRK